MIRSFKNVVTEAIFNGKNTKEARRTCPQILWKVAVRKLDQLDSLHSITFVCLQATNWNRSGATGTGQHSIRINEQYLICFIWTETGADVVEIIDYH